MDNSHCSDNDDDNEDDEEEDDDNDGDGDDVHNNCCRYLTSVASEKDNLHILTIQTKKIKRFHLI